MPQKKRKYTVNTNPKRPIYLLEHSITELPTRQLPSVGNILRYIQFLKTPLSTKFQSNKFHVACPMKTGGYGLVCDDQPCQV